jgi:hypothetical protein
MVACRRISGGYRSLYPLYRKIYVIMLYVYVLCYSYNWAEKAELKSGSTSILNCTCNRCTYLIFPLFVLYLTWLHKASNIPLVVVTYRQSNTCNSNKYFQGVPLKIWQSTHIHKSTKIKIFNSCVNLYYYMDVRHGWLALRFKENCSLSLIAA